MRIIKLLVTLILVSCHLAASELKVEKISSVNNISIIQNSLGSGMSLKKVNYVFTNRIEESISHNGSVIKLENTKQYYYPSRPIVPQKNFNISLSGYYHIDEISISNGIVEHYYTNGELVASDNPLRTDGNMQQEHISQKDREIYDTDAFYPNRWLDFTAGYDGVETQIYIHVFPIQWNPVTKETFFLREFEISISGEPAQSLPIATSDNFFTEAEHIILSPGSWMGIADSIAAFHNIPSAAINIDSLYVYYQMAEDPEETGWATFINEDIHDYQYDNALKIISYLRDLEAHPNLEYITILGSSEIIPPSYYFSNHDSPDYERWMPSDQYYASPEYDWIDNYATTRVPVHDAEALSIYFRKMRDFEDNSNGTWTHKAVVSGGHTWHTSLYFGEFSNNQLICDDIFNGCEIEKFQEMRGNFYAENIKSHWQNEDFLWYFNFSHGGGYDIVYADYTKITNEDVMEFPYKEKLPIIVDKGCWNGVFDTFLYDHPLFSGISLCESVLSSPGAGIAYIAATRASYGQPIYEVINGNYLPVAYSSDYALLYLFLREYRNTLNPTFGKLFKNAKSAFLEEYSMNGSFSTSAYLRFVVHASSALRLPDPLPINSQTEVPIISLENGQTYQYSHLQYAGLSNNTGPIYEISEEDYYDLFTFSIDDEVILSTNNYVTSEFTISGDIYDQIIINRLNNNEQKEAWHYSYLMRTSKSIDGNLADWTDDEIICTDTKGDICAPLDLSDIYASYDEETNSISLALPIEYEYPDSHNIIYFYSFVFDDMPGGFYNNYFEPGYYPEYYLIGFENARINKVITLIIDDKKNHPKYDYRLNYSNLYTRHDGSMNWRTGFLNPPYVDGIHQLGENVLEFTISADSLNLENCKMAVISSKYNSNESWGIADDTIPSSILSPSEPMYGIDYAYSITDYIDLGEMVGYFPSGKKIAPTLYANFPNPFNEGTKIKFNISNNALVDINIYNIRGQKIRDLEKKVYDVGLHFVDWDGKDNNDRSLASGIYIIEILVDGKNQQVQKCMYLK